MLITAVEFMFYNNNIYTGVVYTYLFFNTNRGNFVSKKEVSVFLPDNYNSGYSAKLGCFISSEICLLILTIQLVINLRIKFRSLILEMI